MSTAPSLYPAEQFVASLRGDYVLTQAPWMLGVADMLRQGAECVYVYWVRNGPRSARYWAVISRTLPARLPAPLRGYLEVHAGGQKKVYVPDARGGFELKIATTRAVQSPYHEEPAP